MDETPKPDKASFPYMLRKYTAAPVWISASRPLSARVYAFARAATKKGDGPVRVARCAMQCVHGRLAAYGCKTRHGAPPLFSRRQRGAFKTHCGGLCYSTVPATATTEAPAAPPDDLTRVHGGFEVALSGSIEELAKMADDRAEDASSHVHSYDDVVFTSTLRHYQKDCIIECLKRFKQGITKQAVCLPVGSGKTVTFSELIRFIKPPLAEASKTLVIAHREELLSQANYHIRRLNPALKIGYEKQGLTSAPGDDVIIASVHSLGRKGSERLKRLNPREFKCIIVDEAHHAVANVYMRIFEHFGLERDKASHIFLWGCSATLVRFDQIALGSIFQEIVYSLTMMEMIRKKWLCKPHMIHFKSRLGLASLHGEGDYDIHRLSVAMNTPSCNQIVFEAWRQFADGPGKRHAWMLLWRTHSLLDVKKRNTTVVFATSAQHVYDLVNTFRDHGIYAECILGHTNPHTRRDILDRCRRGQVRVVVNCGVLTEGTDIPNIDCVLLARPTRSTSLFVQMCGRGLRPFPGKQDCLILNIVDSCMRPRSLQSLPTLSGTVKMAAADVERTHALALRREGLSFLYHGWKDALARAREISKDDLITMIDTSNSYCDLDLAYHHLDWVKVSNRLFLVGNLILVVVNELKGTRKRPLASCPFGFLHVFVARLDTCCNLYHWVLGFEPVLLAHNEPIQAALDKAFQHASKAKTIKNDSRVAFWKRMPVTPQQARYLGLVLKEQGRPRVSFYHWTAGMAARVISKHAFFTEFLKKPIRLDQLLDGTVR